MMVRISDWAWIPLDRYTPELLKKLKRRLTVIPRKTSEHQEVIEPIELFKETKTEIGIPRAFYLKTRKKHEVVDKMSRGTKVEVEFSGDLREEQVPGLQSMMDWYRENGDKVQNAGGIIQAFPGFGKTVLAIKGWTKIGCTCVVIVHKEFLVNQWKVRIEKFAPDARVGIIQQDTCEFGDDYDISIAMIQSLRSRVKDYPKELWDWPGLVISDECHRVAAPAWCEIVPNFTAHCRWGFTATPKRKDGAEDVFFTHIGPVIFKSEKRTVIPKLRRIFTKFSMHRTQRFDPNSASKEIQLRFLCADPKRNSLIVSELEQAVSKGRKIIVLSDRLKHLEKLCKKFENLGLDKMADFYVGGRTQAELQEAEKADVLFCTYAMVAEALDIPTLDTVFLTTPRADVEQAVGRISREHPDKKRPIIVDFIDRSVKRFEGLYYQRLKFYNSTGMFGKD